MEKIGKFAVLKYIPDFDRNEKINIGVTLHSPKDEYLKTEIISNWKRVRDFDDEIDILFFKDYVNGIKDEFTKTIKLFDFENNDKNDLANFNLLENMTKYFVNQFQFEIHEIMIDDSCDVMLNNLKKIMLYYDYEKDKRVTANESKLYLQKIMISKNINYYLINNTNKLMGKYNESIAADYKIGENYYKILNFTDENFKQYIATIKMWMLNALQLKEKNKKIIFIVNETVRNKTTEMYKTMLSEYADVINLEDFEKYLTSIYSNLNF